MSLLNSEWWKMEDYDDEEGKDEDVTEAVENFLPPAVDFDPIIL